MHYFPKHYSSHVDSERLLNFVENEIQHAVITLPLLHERSTKLDNELDNIISLQEKNDEILIIRDRLSPHTANKEIVLFGYDRKVNELKKEISSIIEKYILITYDLTSIDPNQMSTLIETQWEALEETEKKYEEFGVNLRIRSHEFSAPSHLKNEIESSILKLLSQPSTTFEFSTIPLFIDMIEKEEQHVKTIAQRCWCSVKTEVDVIIVPATFNGLKEGVVERLGEIEYEKTHVDVDGTMYTETNGGKLCCKRTLFSNWLPSLLINHDNALRFSIKTFVSKSLEYIIQGNEALSIAFAVPDSCANESILADEMIKEAKHQLETRKLQLKISFVCLPEQQTLYEHFSHAFPDLNGVHLFFDWPTATKITRPNDVFHSWDQHTINLFYKYCKDRCVLPKLMDTKNELELMGPSVSLLEVRKKLNILSESMAEKLRFTSIIERPSSAMCHSARSENTTNTKISKLYSIVLSHHPNDTRKCRRLINRLTEEGFSVGTSSNSAEDQRDLCSQMDKSDCIILCISGNYYESSLCLKEAKYAFQIDKKIFLVRIQSNPILGWNNDPFDRKLYFNSFGSDRYFDLEYGRLLIELAWLDEDQTYGIRTGIIQLFNGLSQIFPSGQPLIDFVPRRKPKYYFYDYMVFKTSEGSPFRSEEEMEKRRELDDPEKMKHVRVKLAEYFMQNYKKYTSKDLDIYLTYGQRVKENTLKFEAFHSMDSTNK
ncbi:unnamed protein product [Rotaria sp. Silwood1]|nr:unnamed protein product [Rotaria sp. Silwood1]